MSAAARASRIAATHGMPKDKGRGISFGQLRVRVASGRVISMGRDKGPVSGACAGTVRPNPGYRAFPQHLIAFVQFADGTKQKGSGRFCDEPGLIQEVAWFNILADQAAAGPVPSVPDTSRPTRLTGMPLIQLAADCQQRAAATGKASAPKPAAAKPLIKPATVDGEVLSLRWTETLLQIAELEKGIYHRKVISRDAREAVASQKARKPSAGPVPAVKRPAPKPAVKPSRVMPPVLALVGFLVIATVISAGVDSIFLFVQHTVTYPAECASSIYGPPADSCSHSSQVQSIVWTDAIIYGIAVLMWLAGLAAIVKQGMSGKKAA
jgi:hypothetical protein